MAHAAAKASRIIEACIKRVFSASVEISRYGQMGMEGYGRHLHEMLRGEFQSHSRTSMSCSNTPGRLTSRQLPHV